MAGSFSLTVLLLACSVLHTTSQGLAHPAYRRSDDPDHLQAVVDQLANDLDAVKAQMTAQQNQLTAQITAKDSEMKIQMTAKENELNARIAAQQNELTAQGNKLQNQASEIAALKAVNARTVAFSAYMSDEPRVHASLGSTVPFKGVISNVGGGFNAASSAFTAPVAGQYFFIVHADCSQDFRGINVGRNGHLVFAAHNDLHDGHVTGSALLTLHPGDVITAMFMSDVGFVDAGIESTISGFLVK